MTFHCNRCDVEWHGADIPCWLCGNPGADGEIRQADGRRYFTDQYGQQPFRWQTSEETA